MSKLAIPSQENHSIGKWPRIAANFNLSAAADSFHVPTKSRNEQGNRKSQLFSELFKNPSSVYLPQTITWNGCKSESKSLLAKTTEVFVCFYHDDTIG